MFLEQVKAIRHLQGLGCAGLRALGEGATAIARNDLDARMVAQPLREGGSQPIRQQINRSMSLQVDDDGPVALAFAPGPIVHPYQLRCRSIRQRCLPDQVQQQVHSGDHGEGGC